jgi:hypothetical protein
MHSRGDDRALRVGERLAPFLGAIVLAEIVIAVTSVVGIFMAISQPFGWQSGLQILLFGLMGILLWFADASLAVDESRPAELSVVRAHRELGRQKTGSF